jgi:hypothetical protein
MSEMPRNESSQLSGKRNLLLLSVNKGLPSKPSQHT